MSPLIEPEIRSASVSSGTNHLIEAGRVGKPVTFLRIVRAPDAGNLHRELDRLVALVGGPLGVCGVDVVKKLDDFDFDTFRQMMMKDLLNNDEQKEIIESRVKPMDLGDLIVKGSVAQEVVIVPDKFWVTYRSVSGECDLAVKRLLMEEAKTLEVEDRYDLDKFAFMTLTLGLESINGNPLPKHLDDKGDFNEELFWRKYKYVSHLNLHMIASLGVNYFWYDVRVRKLFVAEKVKNG